MSEEPTVETRLQVAAATSSALADLQENESLRPTRTAFSSQPAPEHLGGKASRWALLTVVTSIIKAALLFLCQMVLARLLSPAEFGILAMAAPVMNLIGVFNSLGLSEATVQRPNLGHDELSSIFWVNMLAGVIVCLCVWASSAPAAFFFHEPALRPVLAWLGLTMIINASTAQHVALLYREMRPWPLTSIELLPVCANLIVSVVAALDGFSYWSLVVGQFAHAVVCTALAWSLSGWRPGRPRLNRGVLPALRFGGHITAYNLINFMATNLDNVMLGAWKGDVTVGLYDRGYKLVLTSYWQVSMPISRIAQSVLARLAGNDARYCATYKRMLEALTISAIPGLLCLSLTGHEAVISLFGSRWSASGPVVAGLAAGTLLAPAGTSASWLLVSQGRTNELFRCGLISTASVIVSLLAGLPWGAAGVAISYAAFSPITHGAIIVGACRTGPVRLRDVVAACGPVFAASLCAAIPLYLCARLLRAAGQSSPVILISETCASYMLCLIVLCLFPSGRRVMRGAADQARLIIKRQTG